METDNSRVFQQGKELVARIEAGAALQAGGQYNAAALCWIEANEFATQSGLKEFQEIALRNLGFCFDELKDYEKSFPVSYQAFLFATELNKHDNVYTLLERLGLCCMQLNSAGAALRFFDELFKMACERADTGMMAQTSYNSGVAHTSLEQYAAALDDFRKAKRYFIESENQEMSVYAADNINRVALLIGEEFIYYTSAAIAAQLTKTEEPLYKGDFKHDLLCALINIIHYTNLTSSIENISFDEPPVLSDDEILLRTGNIIRSITGTNIPNPQTIYEAARLITQVKRGINAQTQLSQIHAGYVEPDISGTGSGKYILYLRSFIAKPVMPQHPLQQWGNVSLEEVLASRLDTGSYPLIALGNPEVQDFGAGKIQTDDATWQRDLIALGKQANYIIVVPCVTLGTSWELEWIVVNQFLRKTVFVMPAADEHAEWWQNNWTALQQWSHYLGLAFPEYNAKGLFFALAPGGGIATVDYHSLLYDPSELHMALLRVLGQYIPSTEWLTPIADNLSSLLISREAKERNVSTDEIIQEHVEQHVQRIETRMKEIEPAVDAAVSPYLLGLVEKGLEYYFSSWTNNSNSVPAITGFYTIWDNNTLLWAAAATDISVVLNLHAEGNIEQDAFSAALFKKIILPYTKPIMRQDGSEDILPVDKLTRLYVRRNLRYRYAGAPGMNAAQQYVDLICRGVLDAGPPVLMK